MALLVVGLSSTAVIGAAQSTYAYCNRASSSTSHSRESVGGRGDFVENDDVMQDNVEVRLYTRPVNGMKSNSSESSSEAYCHWALVFYFPKSGRTITYDANSNNGILEWGFIQQPPNKVDGDEFCKDVATIKTSPKQIWESAKRVQFNGLTYNIVYRNCQEWIIAFAKQIGNEVEKYISEKFKSFLQQNPWQAFVVGGIAELPFVNLDKKQERKQQREIKEE